MSSMCTFVAWYLFAFATGVRGFAWSFAHWDQASRSVVLILPSVLSQLALEALQLPDVPLSHEPADEPELPTPAIEGHRVPLQRRVVSKGKTPQRNCVGESPGPGQWLPRTSTM